MVLSSDMCVSTRPEKVSDTRGFVMPSEGLFGTRKRERGGRRHCVCVEWSGVDWIGREGDRGGKKC